MKSVLRLTLAHAQKMIRDLMKERAALLARIDLLETQLRIARGGGREETDQAKGEIRT